MYGADGWCHACGVPLHAQSGRLCLRRAGLSPLPNAWIPNWVFDTVCLAPPVADAVAARFRIEIREIEWAGGPGPRAFQVVIPTVGPDWFDPTELHRLTIERHGTSGATCGTCGTWRWMPLAGDIMQALLPEVLARDADILASPERFGDGKQAFREVLVRRDLAALLAEASPRDFARP